LAAVFAFDCSTVPSQSPFLAADESSRLVYLMVKLPTFLPSSSDFSSFWMAVLCGRLVPSSGRLE
jgi:hypothetical protein